MSNNFNSLIESIKMMYFMNMKESSNLQNIFMVLFMTLVTFVFNNEICYEKMEDFFKKFFNGYSLLELLGIFQSKRRNSIFLEGKRFYKTYTYSNTSTDNLFSNRFSAFWHYIAKKNLDNPSIYSLKEYSNNFSSFNLKQNDRDYDDYDNRNKTDDSENDIVNDIFIVDQHGEFKLDSTGDGYGVEDKIYCRVSCEHNKAGNSEDKKKYEMENIRIELYSYVLSLKELIQFLDDIYLDYRRELDIIRNNKKFIYTLVGSGDKVTKNEWDECEFSSTRNFDNLFFDDKQKIINKLDFFINNKEWYEYEGHPYTFGIGLHGPPGTGKTSIIKCIANRLNRHIIVIPLSKVKTQSEFNEYFFEPYYNRDNTKKIDFCDKIIVFEDIDCMSDIVKKRNITGKNAKKGKRGWNGGEGGSGDESSDDTDVCMVGVNGMSGGVADKNMAIQNKLLNKIAKKIDDEHVDNFVVDIDKTKDDNITLSYILNIIDGIRETPGRIMVITSNNYDSLDPALIRPGRIDMTLEMKNASVDVINNMYMHYYKTSIPDDINKCICDDIVSPAKLVNMRLENEKGEDFLAELVKICKNNK